MDEQIKLDAAPEHKPEITKPKPKPSPRKKPTEIKTNNDLYKATPFGNTDVTADKDKMIHADQKRKAEYQNDQKIVRGRFTNLEQPGGTMKVMFKKYKGPLFRKEMKDGQVYEVPLMVAKHLNQNCWYPVHTYQQDELGRPSQKIGRKVYRCSFQSLDFLGEDIEARPDIVTVQPLKW